MRFLIPILAALALSGCMVEPAHLQIGFQPDRPQHQAETPYQQRDQNPYDQPHSYCWYNHC